MNLLLMVQLSLRIRQSPYTAGITLPQAAATSIRGVEVGVKAIIHMTLCTLLSTIVTRPQGCQKITVHLVGLLFPLELPPTSVQHTTGPRLAHTSAAG